MKKLSLGVLSAALLTYVFAMPAAGLAESMPADKKMNDTETAVFAGGCFWCTESDFDKVKGVLATTSGYINGHQKNPTYKQVSAGGSGHAEVVKVEYDPQQVSYDDLLDVFWRSIDPTTANAQFCDHGSQYRSGVFYMNETQKKLAMASKSALQKNKPFKEAIVTEISQAELFYPAEEYHQNFHDKNPIRYKYYRFGCGRDARLEELWGSG